MEMLKADVNPKGVAGVPHIPGWISPAIRGMQRSKDSAEVMPRCGNTQQHSRCDSHSQMLCNHHAHIIYI